MIKVRKFFKAKELSFFLLAAILNAFLIIYVYRSVFSLEIQGDTWQYAWAYWIQYGKSIFSPLTLRALRTSLGGSMLTFALIGNTFGLSSIAYYSISVLLKFFTIVAFYLFVKKLTGNKYAGLFSSLILSASFVGIEATHWVFNMYAYIGMVLIISGLIVGLDLPEKFNFKKWLLSFFLVALGIWWGPMRTTGIVIVIIAWSLYKFILHKTADSRRNFLFWLVSFPLLIFVFRTFLGLFEPAYTKYYIWDQWWNFFYQYINQGKYDFLLSPISNVGRSILPDQWLSEIPFYKIFSPVFGLTFFRAVGLPLFLIFIAISFLFSWMFNVGRRLFHRMFILGFVWTAFVFVIYKQGPPNFPSWQALVFTLLGGYFLVWNVALFTLGGKKTLLRDCFFFAFFWSFSFVLTPIVQNGGNTFSTLHRYFVISAATLPIFFAGIISLSYQSKNKLGKFFLILTALATTILHGRYTKQFFDNKAKAHSRYVSEKIWNEFTQIVPKELEQEDKYPVFWFEVNDAEDRERLFESLFFGFVFRLNYKYGWDQNTVSLYYENYDTLVSDVKKDPEILTNFFAIRLENGSLVDITDETRQDLKQKIEKI